ncbi:MAG TPA: HEAT repeat domain-containing protein, partial [Fimbriimonadaceae bacterium]|nr:HEAT repeat domain-containing protein [Fimbriimonadaceae bacterium]
EGALQVRRAIRDLSKVTPRGYRAMRRLAASTDAQHREEAIEAIAERGYALAGDEVLKAMHDPSPRVRRQAALSLAKLGDPNGARELIHQINEHPDLVEEETIEALGQLGGEEAVEPLARTLKSPRSMLRRAAAKALGRIGNDAAIGPLIEAAAEPGDPDLRRASLQALRSLGARQAEAVIADALLDPTPSVRIAAAEAVSELELASACEHLRQSLNYYADEASSEVAYALGAVGHADDIPRILEEAERSVSIITRRRCLLGVARMLGVEQRAYKLLLSEGMARDALVLAITKPLLKGNKRLRDAVQLYSAGDEAAALAQLASGKQRPEINIMAQHPVQELFLVAVAALAHT